MLADPKKHTFDARHYGKVPWVIYTQPEVAWVRQTEEELKKSGIKYKKGTFPFLANSRAKANSDTEGFVKILTDEDDVILGAHILGSAASELIGQVCIAMSYDGYAEDLARTCTAHPTLYILFHNCSTSQLYRLQL